MDLRTYHCHVDTNPFKVKGEEERVYTLLIHTDLNGKEVQKGGDICICTGFPGGSDGKESACTSGDLGLIPGSGRFPWRRAHSSILAWRIPWTEKPGGLQSMGS